MLTCLPGPLGAMTGCLGLSWGWRTLLTQGGRLEAGVLLAPRTGSRFTLRPRPHHPVTPSPQSAQVELGIEDQVLAQQHPRVPWEKPWCDLLGRDSCGQLQGPALQVLFELSTMESESSMWSHLKSTKKCCQGSETHT